MSTATRMVVLPRARHDARETSLRHLVGEASRLAGDNQRLRDQLDAVARNPLFIGRCYLCGHRIHPRRLLCPEHAWAQGEVSFNQKGRLASSCVGSREPARKEPTP
jgi:uncharacterized OB-fold protein